MIAHRLSTIKDSDKIVVLKNGRLIEEGDHKYLMDNFPQGTYAGFCEKQAKAEDDQPAGSGDDEALLEELAAPDRIQKEGSLPTMNQQTILTPSLKRLSSTKKSQTEVLE